MADQGQTLSEQLCDIVNNHHKSLGKNLADHNACDAFCIIVGVLESRLDVLIKQSRDERKIAGYRVKAKALKAAFNAYQTAQQC